MGKHILHRFFLPKGVSPLLAVVGLASTIGAAVASGASPAPSVMAGLPDGGRQPPTFFLMQVVKGEADNAQGLAPLDMETAWQAKTLSDDPLRVTAGLVTRYPEPDNGGRKCARVKGGLGQDAVPLKGHVYADCARGTDACKPFWIWTELDMCEDGLPPTANYGKYRPEAAATWAPPVTEVKGGK